MIELYHNDMSVCAQKVRLTLSEKKLAWTGHHMNLRAGEQHTPEYIKLNPLGVVPTLVDNGRVLIESTVICEYLDDAYPDIALRPADPFARGQMRLWMKKLDDWVHADIGTVSSCIAFRHQYLQRFPTPEAVEAHLVHMPSKDKQDRQRANILKGVASPYFTDAVRRLAHLFGQINSTLEHSPWLVGDEYSLADIGYTPYFLRIEHLGLGEAIFGERVRAWGKRLMARPNYSEAVGSRLPAEYLTLFAEHRGQATAQARTILAAA